MKNFISNYLILVAFFSAIGILLFKSFVLPLIHIYKIQLIGVFDFSDVTIVYTGAFFVISLILAGTLTDYKESERIPGEIASNLESIEDWMILGLKAPRIVNPSINTEPLDKEYVKNQLIISSNQIVSWIHSKEKDSLSIFPFIRNLNEVAYYYVLRGADREAVKGIQENTNQLRKNLTRIYAISRTNFIKPAYTLAQSILSIIIFLLLMAKFKTPIGDMVVTFSLSFVFIYLYFLIVSLDDPFNITSKTKVDLKPLYRFTDRLKDSF